MRPTADRIRGAIFDVLGARTTIEGKDLLDLFAGTGAIGLEALSRGAASVLFVDATAEACRLVRENLVRSGYAERGHVRRARLPRGLRRVAEADKPSAGFAGVFLDPPYRRDLAAATLAELDRTSLVSVGGWVLAEHATSDALDERYGALERAGTWSHGSTMLSLYEVRAA